MLAFPLVAFGIFVVNPFVLYFSSLYELTLHNGFVHELMHAHFIVTGCLFFWPLLGRDPLPGRWPYPARALLMVLSVPFHTVLGLTIMQSATLLGGDWYPSLNLPWVDPVADQVTAGGVLWAGGEFVSVAMLAVLVAQWIGAVAARSGPDRPTAGPSRGRGNAAARIFGMTDRTVLLYSDDPEVRERMRLAIGAKPGPDLHGGVRRGVDLRRVREARRRLTRSTCWCSTARRPRPAAWASAASSPTRSRNCPPRAIVIARAADRWLAAYAKADATLLHPLDPVTTAATVAELLVDRTPVTA